MNNDAGIMEVIAATATVRAVVLNTGEVAIQTREVEEGGDIPWVSIHYTTVDSWDEQVAMEDMKDVCAWTSDFVHNVKRETLRRNSLARMGGRDDASY